VQGERPSTRGCLKLERNEDGRYLKEMDEASALRADWKRFRGYYRKITKNWISEDDSEEINAVRIFILELKHVLTIIQGIWIPETN
jgi:hypothetical protein